jgi:hypothetical protein
VSLFSEDAGLLDKLHEALTRYVAFPSPEAADAVTLWVAATHGQAAWEHAPRLAAVSPLKRCGKSRLLDVIAETCHRPLVTVNATIAAIARSVASDDPPTLLVDEADAIFGTKRQADNNEDLRGLLNAGHQRNRPMLRWDITTRSLESLDTFAMAMLASIGDLPDTIMDRAVVVRMRRRAPGEQVAPYRTRRDAPPLNDLRDQLTDFIGAHLDELEAATPEMPLEDREADTWEPLIAVADLAGGDWPVRARKAATALTAAEQDADTDASLGLRLLADLREVFALRDDDGTVTGWHDRLDSKALLERLYKLDEAPWDDLYGKRLDARGLAQRLRPYGVRPKVIRVGASTPRGYERADFRDAWTRYLPAERNSRNDRNAAGQPVADDSVLQQHDWTRNAPTSDVAYVAGVADAPEDNGWNLEPSDPRRFAR